MFFENIFFIGVHLYLLYSNSSKQCSGYAWITINRLQILFLWD